MPPLPKGWPSLAFTLTLHSWLFMFCREEESQKLFSLPSEITSSDSFVKQSVWQIYYAGRPARKVCLPSPEPAAGSSARLQSAVSLRQWCPSHLLADASANCWSYRKEKNKITPHQSIIVTLKLHCKQTYFLSIFRLNYISPVMKRDSACAVQNDLLGIQRIHFHVQFAL